jgi:uncharacterized membrane protein
MSKGRMEAFSDGVLAIIITIMVIELHPPHEPTLEALRQVWPVLLSYVLSFFFLGIYWNNHHHLLQAVSQVNGRILWANLHLLFWLSLVPFTTNWVGDTHFAPVPAAVYGAVLLMAGVAYFLLTGALIRQHGKASALAAVVGRTSKEKLSVLLYAIAIPLALRVPGVAFAIYGLVALVWLIPDRRIERALR